MANQYLNNIYYIDTQAVGRVANWPSSGRVQSVMIYALDTTARATFQVYAGTPFFEFSILTHGTISTGSASTILGSTYSYDFGGTRFDIGWIPTTLTACTAWVHFE